MHRTTYEEILYSTIEIFAKLRSFSKVPRKKLDTFSVDLALVASGIRTGYLFDSFYLTSRASQTSLLQIFEELLEELRKKIGIFGRVVILANEEATDIVFINVTLLLQRLEDIDLPSFVSLNTTPYLLHDQPVGVEVHLNGLRTSLLQSRSSNKPYPLSITASWPSDCPHEAVPIAAVLLEYPVAYVPNTTDSRPFLSDVDLEVFTCSLVSLNHSSDRNEHVLLQFSCPRSLVAEIGDINEKLRKRFDPRILDADLPYEVHTSNRTERLDRVAL